MLQEGEESPRFPGLTLRSVVESRLGGGGTGGRDPAQWQHQDSSPNLSILEPET